jgi:hypothetical protein
VRKSNRLGALPTLNRFPARRDGIHLPQTRAQISAKAEAICTKILEDEAAKANLEASRREELQGLMADKISTMQSVPAGVPSSPDPMDVDKEEAEQEVIEDTIIDIGSSDVKDAPPQNLPLPLANIAAAEDVDYLPSPEHAPSFESDDDGDSSRSPETDTKSPQPFVSEATKTARKGRLPSKTKVRL